MKNLMRRAKRKSGVVLPFVLIVGVATLVLGASVFTAANASSALSKSSVSGRQAYLNAKSGVEYAKGVIAKNAEENGTLANFSAVGVVTDQGNANFAQTNQQTDAPIYVECTVSSAGSGLWDVEVVSIGQGNFSSELKEEPVEQKVVFTTTVKITGGASVVVVDNHSGDHCDDEDDHHHCDDEHDQCDSEDDDHDDDEDGNRDDGGSCDSESSSHHHHDHDHSDDIDVTGNGTGFDSTIMTSDGAPYTDGTFTLLNAPETAYSVLFQNAIKANSTSRLIAQKLYFAYKGTAPSLLVNVSQTASVKADYLYFAGNVVADGTSSTRGKLTITSNKNSRTVIFFAKGSSVHAQDLNIHFAEDTLYEVPTGTDLFTAIKGISGTTILPLTTGNTIFESEIAHFDATVRNLGETGSPVLGSFVSGNESGWTGAYNNPLLSVGTPSSKVGSTVCWYAAGGSGQAWDSATHGVYSADIVRMIWDSADVLSIPAVPSGETSFTIAADMISLNIRSRSIAPVSATGSSFIVKTVSGTGDVALYVAHNTYITQKDGTNWPLLPGWYSLRSGTDLFSITSTDYSFDASVIDDARFAAVVTNNGNKALTFTAKEGVKFDGHITVPKNKQLTVRAADFHFNDDDVDHEDTGNHKQTFILESSTGLDTVLVTFEKAMLVEQAASTKKSPLKYPFPAGAYLYPSGVDLLNYDPLKWPATPYDPAADTAPNFVFTFSKSVFR